MIRLGDKELVREQGPLTIEVLPQTEADRVAGVYRVRCEMDARLSWRTVENGYDGSFCRECGEDLPAGLVQQGIEYHEACAGVGASGQRGDHDDDGQVG